MSSELKNIVNLLTSLTDEAATTDALAWLRDNPTHKSVKHLIVQLERFSTQDDVVEQCADWLLEHPGHLQPSKPSRKQARDPFWCSHSVNLSEYRRVAANLQEDSAQKIAELLSTPSPHVVALALQWLETYDPDNTNVQMMTDLLHASPTPANCARANALQLKTADTRNRNNLLSTLIKFAESPVLIREALEILAANKDFESNEFLAEAIIQSNCDGQSKQKAIDWWHSANRNERERDHGFVFRYGILEEDSIAERTIAEMKASSDEQAQLLCWCSVLIKIKSESIITDCWNWLEANRGHKNWQGIFSELLLRARQHKVKIPIAAVEQIWQFEKRGIGGYVEYLLTFDKTEQTIEYAFGLAKRLAKEDEPIDGLVAALIEADPSEEKIDFAIKWVQSNLKHGDAVWRSVEVLLKVTPPSRVNAIARQQVINADHQSVFLSTLVKMAEAVRDEWSIKLARVFMERECRYGIRQNMCYDCAPLLILLLELDKSMPELQALNRAHAQQWLTQFDRLRKEDAIKLRNELAGSR